MDPTALSDDELFRCCQDLRVQATRGDLNAMHEARILEAEARRRFQAATTIAAPMAALPVARRAWWRFW